MISGFALIKEAFSLIKKEKLILIPSITAFLMINSLQPYLIKNVNLENFIKDFSVTFPIFRLVFVQWIVTLFFAAFTICMAITIHKNKTLDIPSIIKKVSLHLFPILIATGVIFLPALLYVWLQPIIIGSDLPALLKSIFELFALIIMIIFIVFSILIVQFLPIFILDTQHSMYKCIKLSIHFVINNLYGVFIVFSFSYFVKLVTTILASMFITIPVLGVAVFQALFNGFSACIGYIMFVIFYETINSKKSIPKIVDINA